MEKVYDKTKRAYSGMKDDDSLIKAAKNYEENAKMHEGGKRWPGGSALGRVKALSPFNIGNEYSAAARNWIKAKEPKKAYEDYIKATEAYLKSAELEKKYMISKGFKSDNENYGIKHKNSIKASEEAQRQAERLKKVLEGRWHGLEGKIVASILTLGFFTLSIFFINPNLSGKVISNLTQNTSSFIGVILFIAGLVEAFVLFRKF